MANQRFMHLYTNEFIEKIFYFCLKKCTNPTQAEDLASEINCQILTALHRGAPQHFHAWVWAIARNQYSKWAIRNRLMREHLCPDYDDVYAATGESSVEDAHIHCEQLKILRRELAFVAKEYRDILVAYYIEGKKTEQIAQALHIPKGTVLSKLHRIRNKLKEGFDMSREFGVLSYKPEDVGFIMNGQAGRDGTPMSFFCRLIAKNIMLATYRNPMTAEELAIEMGIALPYMENELSHLIRAQLIRQDGDRYETAIFIVSAKAQARCYEHQASIASKLAACVIKMVELRTGHYEQKGIRWHEGYQDYVDMKWALLMRRVDELYAHVIGTHKPKSSAAHAGHNGRTIRPNYGQWDLLGLEIYDAQRPPFIGLHGTGETAERGNSGYMYQFGQYKFEYEQIGEQTPANLTEELSRALVDVARLQPGNSPVALLDQLTDYGYLEKIDGQYRPTFWVWFNEKLGEPIEEDLPEYQQLTASAISLLDSLYLVCREAILQEIPVSLQEDEHQINHAIANIMLPREAVFVQALRSGWLTYDAADPQSAKRRMLGAFLAID